MKLIGYVRTSSRTKEAQEDSRPAQEQAMQRWARRQRHRLVGFCHDEGVSGTTLLEDRPGLSEAVGMIRRGRADGLVVRELDRLSRDVMVQEGIFDQVWSIGADTVVLSTKPSEEHYCSRNDPDDPNRQFIRQTLGIAAQLQRNLIVARLRNGKRVKAAQGGYIGGRPPYGYAAVGKDLVPDPAEQAVLQRIRRMHRQGASIRQIARTLNHDGVPTKRGKTWHANTVARVLAR